MGTKGWIVVGGALILALFGAWLALDREPAGTAPDRPDTPNSPLTSTTHGTEPVVPVPPPVLPDDRPAEERVREAVAAILAADLAADDPLGTPGVPELANSAEGVAALLGILRSSTDRMEREAAIQLLGLSHLPGAQNAIRAVIRGEMGPGLAPAGVLALLRADSEFADPLLRDLLFRGEARLSSDAAQVIFYRESDGAYATFAQVLRRMAEEPLRRARIFDLLSGIGRTVDPEASRLVTSLREGSHVAFDPRREMSGEHASDLRQVIAEAAAEEDPDVAVSAGMFVTPLTKAVPDRTFTEIWSRVRPVDRCGMVEMVALHAAEERLPVLTQLMAGEGEREVREVMSNLVRGMGGRELLPNLRDWRNRETDMQIRATVSAAIARIEKLP